MISNRHCSNRRLPLHLMLSGSAINLGNYLPKKSKCGIAKILQTPEWLNFRILSGMAPD